VPSIAAPEPDNEEERLAALQRLDLLDQPRSPELEEIVEIAASMFSTPIALVSLVDAERQWFAAAVGLEAPETPRCDAFCAYSILEPPIFVVGDATMDERFAGNALVTGAPDIRFYAGAVISSPEGLPIGTLCVIDREPRSFSDEQRLNLRGLAGDVERHVLDRAGVVR
jgi:GAF domain-containing protein